jgi:lysozyme family protein
LYSSPIANMAPVQGKGEEAERPSVLDNIEQTAKIFATVAVPVIVALGGWIIQTSMEHDKERAAKIAQDQQAAIDKDKISLEYVKIAKDILTSSEKEIPGELTTWSWRLLDGVSPIKFDKAALERLIERKDRIPAPSVPTVATSFAVLAPEYEQMFKVMRLTVPSEQVDLVIAKIQASLPRYAALEKTTGVPWFVIGVAHYLERGLDFEVHLHNGDPLGDRTVKPPVGRPLSGQPPFTWDDSARDAFELAGFGRVQDWPLTRILFELERYNGFGYRRSHVINSPYLWNCTSQYTKGLYRVDHVFDPLAVPDRCGGAALIKRMLDRQLIALK